MLVKLSFATRCFCSCSFQMVSGWLRTMLIHGLNFWCFGCGTRLASFDDSFRTTTAQTGETLGIPQGSTKQVQWWLSSEDVRARLASQPDLPFLRGGSTGGDRIQLDDSLTYQSVLGLGSSLEHSTCYNLSLLPEARREKAIESLVHPERGIGMNLMRICIGTSDFAPGPFYTDNDLPAGQEDPRLEHFSIEHDRDMSCR